MDATEPYVLEGTSSRVAVSQREGVALDPRLEEWGLPEMDEEAVVPRIMTAVHPEAVGSYGSIAVAWMEERSGRPLRWWQALVVHRALEHREDSSLCWPFVVLSTTRQVGKSYLLREMILFRMTHPEYFGGDEQTIVYTANHLDVAREVWRPAMLWAKGQAWPVRLANGEQMIEEPQKNSRWLVRATGNAGFGFTINMPVLDEAWSVHPTVVDDQLAPTMIEAGASQLWMVSTAHPEATPLMPTFRRTGIAQAASPQTGEGAMLMLEWSASPGRDSSDEEGWMEASPFWNERRRSFVADRLEKATDERSFRCQWLNEWPRSSVLGLADEQVWLSLGVPDLFMPEDRHLWCALEAVPGGGATVVFAWQDDDGRTAVLAEHRLPMLRALTRVTEECGSHPGSTLLLGASLDKMVDRSQFPGTVMLAGVRETRQATHLFQGLVAEGRIRHDGDSALALQIVNAVVAVTDQGAVMSGSRSPVPTDAARATLWVVWAAHTATANEPMIY